MLVNSFKTRTLIAENSGALVPSPQVMFTCLTERWAEVHCAYQSPLWSQADQVVAAAAAGGTKEPLEPPFVEVQEGRGGRDGRKPAAVQLGFGKLTTSWATDVVHDQLTLHGHQKGLGLP